MRGGPPRRASAGWVILDLQDGKPHVPQAWADPRDAFRELLDLLLPYPLNSEWRRRLEVERWEGEHG